MAGSSQKASASHGHANGMSLTQQLFGHVQADQLLAQAAVPTRTMIARGIERGRHRLPARLVSSVTFLEVVPKPHSFGPQHCRHEYVERTDLYAQAGQSHALVLVEAVETRPDPLDHAAALDQGDEQGPQLRPGLSATARVLDAPQWRERQQQAFKPLLHGCHQLLAGACRNRIQDTLDLQLRRQGRSVRYDMGDSLLIEQDVPRAEHQLGATVAELPDQFVRAAFKQGWQMPFGGRQQQLAVRQPGAGVDLEREPAQRPDMLSFDEDLLIFEPHRQHAGIGAHRAH